MPDELVQTAEAPPEQTLSITPEQTQEAAPTGEGDAVSGGEGAAPEPVKFASDAELRAFLESDDVGRSYLEKLKNDQFNAARQNVEAELRRAVASDEVIAARLQNIALVNGWDADDETLKKAVAAFHEPATRRQQVEARRFDIEAAKQSFSAEARAAIDIAVEQAGEDPWALTAIVGQLWNYQGQSAREQAISSLSLDDIPAESKLHKEIEDRVAKQLEAELAARERAAGRQEVAPRASQGGPSTGGPLESVGDYETKLATVGLSEAEWKRYEQLRVTAGMR